ncbi:MAG: putative signal peptide peptidase SppA [Verrucomicrobia bacterium ADurb.Bin345]|nr:MAG: putative signal peptide peptidase SppA [Verrucomicrobia bacterium ADurb.Bin345]
MQKDNCSHAGFWITISLLAVLVIASLAANMGLLIGLAAAGAAQGPGGEAEDEFPFFVERWSYGTGTTKVVRIPVEGIIFREAQSSFFGRRFDKVEAVLRQIRAATADEEMRGIILEVNSPGGELTASDEIYEALRLFKERDDRRRIVAFTRNVSASGGYYVSMQADWIVAEPTAIVGSIGVIMQSLNWKGLSDRIGITDTTIKSGTNKDLLNPFRDVPPEQLALLQEVVDTFYNRFFDIVRTSRGLDAETLKPIADGRIVSAEVALKHKLIDQVGYWEAAMAKAAELLGETSLQIIRYEHRPSFSELFASVRSPALDFGSLTRVEAPRFMYLWQP